MPSIYGEYVKRSRLRLDYSYTQSIANNTTTFTLTLYAEKPSGMGTHSYNYHDSVYAISGKDGNQLINGTGDWSWGNVTEYKVGESTYTYTHNSDGTGSCWIGGAWITGLSNSSVVGYRMEVGETITLPTIPRKSSLTVSAGTIGGTNPTFTISRKSNSFTDSIYYINPANSQEVLIVNKTSLTSYGSWTAPTSLYASFPNASSITLTYKIYTYNGSTLVGSDTATGVINANVSASRPTVSVTATPTDYSSLTGTATTIINGVSNVTISATGTPKNSATIKSIVTNGETIATNTTSGSKTINKVTTGTFTTTVTDSRGFTNSPLDTKTFEFVNYAPLKITAEANRTNQTSSTIKAKVTCDFYDGKFGSSGRQNTLTLTWQCKNNESDNWTTGGTLTATKVDGKYTTGEITLTKPSTIDFSYESDIYFQFKATDLLDTTGKTATPKVRKGTPILDYGVDANGNNYLNVNGGIYQFNIPIIERGTNYIKFYDGTAIWRKAISVTATIQTAWGSLYETASTVSLGNFDSNVFIEKPFVSVQSTGIACWVESVTGTTKTEIGSTYLSRPVSSASTTYNFDVIAIGKWK